MPPTDELVKDLRHIFAYISKDAGSIDEQNHRIKFVVSTDKLDRDCEIVLPEAVAEAATRKGEFVDNPVALACHLHRLIDGMPPAIGSWDVSTLKATAHRVEMWLQFAIDTKLGGEYWKLYSKQHMRAVSIGFRILDGHEEVKDGKRFYIITKIELYEISCVAVGANPQALSKLKEFYLPGKDGDNFVSVPAVLEIKKDNTNEKLLQRMGELQEGIDEIKSLLTPDSDKMAEELLGGGLGSDNSVPAGDKKKQAARLLNVLQKAVDNL